MNVLVVDDEPIIRIGLRSLVDWERHGLSLVGEAEDGIEALDMIDRLGVDLVITDLLMPRMDGLELLRRIKDEQKDVGVIVLSCLDDFAWVKEAMKLGAREYVLKPSMEPEQLIGIVDVARQELEQRREERGRLERWQRELEETKQVHLSVRLQAFMQRGHADDRLEAELFGPRPELRSLLVCRKPQLEPVLAGLDYTAALQTGPDQLLLLCGEDQADMLMPELSARLGGQEEASADFFIGIGSPAISRLADLPASLEWHERQLQHRFYAGAGSRLVTDAPEPPAPLPLPHESRNDLLRAVGSGNPEGFRHHARELGKLLAEARRPAAEAIAFVSELLVLTVGYARDRGYARMDDFERDYVQAAPARACAGIRELQQLLTHAFEELGARPSGFTDPGGARATHPFVRKALSYMREHYRLNIGTADIAEHVKLSRSYLSDLYGKETGESLTETLTLIRIGEAKRLLRSGELKVYEVAEAVGIPDAKTFAKTFKRIAGCTPKEYEQSNK